MNEGIIERLVKALEPVAAKLGEGAGQVYELAIRQAMVQGILDLAWGVFWALVAIGLALGVRKVIGKMDKCGHENNYCNCDEPFFWATALLVFAMVPATIMGLTLLSRSLPALLNPRFRALQILLDQIT